MLIGRVTNVEFIDDWGVTVTVGIDPGVKIHRDEVCRIKSTIVGDAVLEFVPRHVIPEPRLSPAPRRPSCRLRITSIFYTCPYTSCRTSPRQRTPPKTTMRCT